MFDITTMLHTYFDLVIRRAKHKQQRATTMDQDVKKLHIKDFYGMCLYFGKNSE